MRFDWVMVGLWMWTGAFSFTFAAQESQPQDTASSKQETLFPKEAVKPSEEGQEKQAAYEVEKKQKANVKKRNKRRKKKKKNRDQAKDE